jgi:hypothetical protein
MKWNGNFIVKFLKYLLLFYNFFDTKITINVTRKIISLISTLRNMLRAFL